MNKKREIGLLLGLILSFFINCSDKPSSKETKVAVQKKLDSIFEQLFVIDEFTKVDGIRMDYIYEVEFEIKAKNTNLPKSNRIATWQNSKLYDFLDCQQDYYKQEAFKCKGKIKMIQAESGWREFER
jgi:hypothetical protein